MGEMQDVNFGLHVGLGLDVRGGWEEGELRRYVI